MVVLGEAAGKLAGVFGGVRVGVLPGLVGELIALSTRGGERSWVSGSRRERRVMIVVVVVVLLLLLLSVSAAVVVVVVVVVVACETTFRAVLRFASLISVGRSPGTGPGRRVLRHDLISRESCCWSVEVILS